MTDVKPAVYVNNMHQYALDNITGYGGIAEIPEGHLPTDINTTYAQDWTRSFGLYIGGSNTNLPDPFYDTSNATNMQNMFSYCGSFDENGGLKTVPNFDTSNVTDMSYMFNICNRIKTVPNFNTSKVVNTVRMFSGCWDLVSVPNFNLSNVTDMTSMFVECYDLTSIPNFDTSNVTDMGYTFTSCYNLTTVPNFDTSKVTDMSSMFYGCRNLTTVPNFDISNVTNMNNMFYGSGIVDYPKFNMSNVKNTYNMFRNCYNLTTVPNMELSNVSNAAYMFYNCSKLEKIPVINFPNRANICYLFQNCKNIQGDLYLTSNNLTAYGVLANCTRYTKNVYVYFYSNTYYNGFNSYRNRGQLYTDINAYVKDIRYNYAEILFTGEGEYTFPASKIQIVDDIDNSLQVIDISPYENYQLSYVESDNNMHYIYHGTKNWGIRINDSSSMKFRFFANIMNMPSNLVDLGQIKNMANFAYRYINNHENISDIPLAYSPENIDTSIATNWSGAFLGCRTFTSLPDPFYNTDSAINMSNMFGRCWNITTVPNFDTSKVTNMSHMFDSCYNLTTVPNFDTSKVTNMSHMFDSCYNLTTANNFDIYIMQMQLICLHIAPILLQHVILIFTIQVYTVCLIIVIILSQ